VENSEFATRRSRRLSRTAHRFLLVWGCAIVLLLLGSSHWQATASLRALADLRRHAERVEHLDSILIQLIDAEHAVRGYLLSGNRNHLQPFESAESTVQITLDQIRKDLGGTPENDAAIADLAGLVSIKLKTLEQAVGRGSAGRETRTEGKRYTDRLRDRVFSMKTRLAEEGEASYERSQRHIERTRWVVGVLTAGALALMVILMLVLERQFQLREQLARLLHSENQRLDTVVRERTAELSDLASYLTNAREAEKSRLARELHDELGALLTAAKMQTGWLGRELAGPSRDACGERLARLEQLLDSGIALKRRIIDDLRPPLLEILGLVSALRALAEDFGRNGDEALTLELPEEDLRIEPEVALALFRIAQEALTNIRKHARARRVTLSLHHRRDSLELEITDDGAGFRPSPERWRHGLAGMKHRVQMCGGEFTLASRPRGGTRIFARIPVAANVAAPENRIA
jgi:protein-histidine pros-kinase